MKCPVKFVLRLLFTHFYDVCPIIMITQKMKPNLKKKLRKKQILNLVSTVTSTFSPQFFYYSFTPSDAI